MPNAKPACNPCNQNCEQGRRCPARQAAPTSEIVARVVKLLRRHHWPRAASPH